MAIIKTKFSKLVLNTQDIIDTIDAEEFERRRDAAKYTSRLMKKNVSNKGVSSPGGYPARMSGTTKRKIGHRLIKADRSALVGTKDFKAHLLEFGHGDGKTRNKRPFVFPTFRQARHGIEKIMSRRYW